MRLAVLTNRVTAPPRAAAEELIAESEPERTAAELRRLLSPRHELVPLAVSGELLAALRPGLFDVAVNLAEAVGDRDGSEHLVAAALETAGLAYTGSGPLALALAQDKGRVRALLEAAGVRVPPGRVVLDPEQPADPPLAFPLIVKPAGLHASIGIDGGAVVRDSAALIKAVRRMGEAYRQPALVERYIDGREISCALLSTAGGWKALPLSEILFPAGPGARVVSYRSKWVPGSSDAIGQPVRCPADLPQRLSAEIEAVARAAVDAVGCRDYARVDFRLAGEKPEDLYVIDVNPNPSLEREAGFARSAAVSGLGYGDLIEHLLHLAAARSTPQPARGPCIEISSAHLRARSVGPADVPVLVRWFNDPDVARYMDDPDAEYSEEGLFPAFFVHSRDLDLVIEEGATGRPVGYGSVYGFDSASGRAEMSFLIGESSCRGRGLGRELAALVVRAAFARDSLFSLLAYVNPENGPSIRVCESLGFRRAGVLTARRRGDRQSGRELVLELPRERFLQG
jgi:D-alanine-D-alanine ligase